MTLLTGVLGAVVIELLPPQMLAAQVTFGGIVLVALISAFLPVPVAFDVAVAFIAWWRGMPLPYAVTILCTLGIVSVYSLSVVGKSLSWSVAAAACATVAAIGTLAGLRARSIAEDDPSWTSQNLRWKDAANRLDSIALDTALLCDRDGP